MVDTPHPPTPTRWTLPNALSAFRLVCSPALVALAWAGLPGWCLALFLILSLSDWLDGKLAILWKQSSPFGARLDTAADVTFYACAVGAVLLLRSERLWPELPWLGAVAASYALSVVASLAKYGRVPSYHTRLAKTSWLLAAVAVVALLADGWVWPARLAAGMVVLTNLEATAITLASPAWRADVPSLYHAWRDRDAGRCGG